MDVSFPRKSHAGYFDKGLQKKFYSKKEKEKFLKTNGMAEIGPAPKAHIKHVKEFTAWSANEKKKNPNWKCTEKYPG